MADTPQQNDQTNTDAGSPGANAGGTGSGTSTGAGTSGSNAGTTNPTANTGAANPGNNAGTTAPTANTGAANPGNNPDTQTANLANVGQAMANYATHIPRQPDSLAIAEQSALYSTKNDKFKLNYKNSYLIQRNIIGYGVFALIFGWLAMIFVIILFAGLGHIPFRESKFELSDTVIITLITTTTINIIAMLILVIKNLFHDKHLDIMVN